MSASNPLKFLQSGLNVIGQTGSSAIQGGLRSAAAVATLGASELVPRAMEANKPLERIESVQAPPTLEDAKKKAQKMGPMTYGRSGTIRNVGGRAGLASSVLNLSAPTLLGS